MAKYINLTQGKRALVDDHWYGFLNRFKWRYVDGYALSSHNTPPPELKGEICMHRVIQSSPKGMVTDHINRDKLDNREVNLRSVTHQENSYNHSYSKGKSKYKGVSYNTDRDAWTAHVGKSYLGSFKTEEEAARAYNDEVKSRFGDKAWLNEVKDGNFEKIIRKRNMTPKMKSKYIGVDKGQGQKWRARIRKKHIGSFDTEIEAALAYNNKAVELYGDKAKLNIIDL